MASIKLIKSISQVTIFKYANEVAAFKHLVRFFYGKHSILSLLAKEICHRTTRLYGVITPTMLETFTITLYIYGVILNDCSRSRREN
jgi:hypothetical protein